MNNYNSNGNIESNINNNINNNNNNSNNNGYLNNTSDQDLHSLHHKNANSTDIPRDNDADVEDRSQHEEEEDDDEVLELDDDHSPRGHNLIHSHQQFQQQQLQQQRQYQHQQHLQQMQQQTHTSPNNNSIHHTTNHQHLDHSENIRLRKSSFDYNDYNQTNLTTEPQLSTSLSNSKTSSNLLNPSNQSLKQYSNNNSNEDNNHNIGVQNATQRNIQFTNHVHPYTTNSHHTLNSQQQQQQQQKHHVNPENSGSVVSHQHTLQANSISLQSHQQHSQNQLAVNLNNAQPDNFPTLYSSSTHSPGNQIRDTQLTHSSTPDSLHTTPHDQHQNQHQNHQQQQNHQQKQTEIQNKVTKAKRTNKPGAKFGAKKKSWVWNWFFQDHMDTNKATCKKCNKLIIRLPNDKSSPKKLIEHLKTHRITRSTIELTPVSNNLRSMNEDTSPFQIDSITELSGNDTDIKDSPNQTIKDEGVNIYDKPVRLKRSSDDSGTNVDYKKSRTSSVENNNNKDRDSYSSLNFQRDIIDFLKENKLPIKTIKSKSFRKLILNLKPSAVKELDDLDNFYSSFIEIFNYSKGNGDSNDGKKDIDDDDDEEEEEESDVSTIDYDGKVEGNIYKSAGEEEELIYNK